MKEIELEILNLLESHPKCLTIITNHFMKVMIDSFDNEEVPEEFKKSMMELGISKERLAMIISGAPRCLFTPFDEQEIYIEVYRTTGKKFTYRIEDYETPNFSSEKRIDCELEAIKSAFEILEDKS